MIDKAKIETIVKSYIRGTDMFLVNLKVTRDNKITIFVDTPTDITIEQCAELNRFIECNLSRDEEDYELQVSSPGIGHTFVVKEQYIKNLRNIIEVTHLNGEKFKGILKN
ncbi:MAG: ribosome assembly cofactor RimP, partial [Bacteroidales bacterium]